MDNNYNIDALLDTLEQQVRDWMQARGIADPLLVGIHTAGVWIAEHLQQRLQLAEEPGSLSVTFYRDDFSRVGLHPQSKPSLLPDVNNRHVLLIDDVIYTGRTLRGAMNELFDFGRPASITVAVLVARQGRELPIEPQLAALHAEPGAQWHIEVTGPQPLALAIVPRAAP